MRLYEFTESVLASDEATVSSLLKKMREEWERFVEGREPKSDVIPVEVYCSWKRCRELSLNPFYWDGRVVVRREKELEFYRQVYSRHQTFFDVLKNFFSGEEFIITFYDRYCKVDINHGEPLIRLYRTSHTSNSTLGACADEEVVGTNAISLAVRQEGTGTAPQLPPLPQQAPRRPLCCCSSSRRGGPHHRSA